ncbi:Lsr2 family protein [Nocardiopsis deserti]|uniref:Lsr2 family protein n=1 Tax=Nocardiopsis deserti TaxID=2605988 RepID=UPI00123A93FA|nr:Lsr2 family protein [Nocardiopsis deserti]
MVTEVFTLKYCDPHAVSEEKVEATEVIQFAWEGVVREVDACADCFKEHEARLEPLVDYSRPVKKRRVTKKAASSSSSSSSASAEGSDDSDDSADGESN